jgi:mRNA-degrading endonuclease YafQ of YafQ-DinJ toxin-antitoxin module
MVITCDTFTLVLSLIVLVTLFWMGYLLAENTPLTASFHSHVLHADLTTIHHGCVQAECTLCAL